MKQKYPHIKGMKDIASATLKFQNMRFFFLSVYIYKFIFEACLDNIQCTLHDYVYYVLC